jgi:hypothetical protein
MGKVEDEGWEGSRSAAKCGAWRRAEETTFVAGRSRQVRAGGGAGEQAGISSAAFIAHDDGQAGEAVFEDGDGGDAEQGAVHAADAAEDARAAEHDGGDGEEFVAGAGVGLGLAEARRVDDRGEGGDEAGEHVDLGEAAVDGQAGEAGALRREADGAEFAAMGCGAPAARANATAAKIQACVGRPSQRSWPRKRNAGGKIRVGDGAARDGLGETAKQRNVPSVTMSGGRRRAVMSAALRPPPAAPRTSVSRRRRG